MSRWLQHNVTYVMLIQQVADNIVVRVWLLAQGWPRSVVFSCSSGRFQSRPDFRMTALRDAWVTALGRAVTVEAIDNEP